MPGRVLTPAGAAIAASVAFGCLLSRPVYAGPNDVEQLQDRVTYLERRLAEVEALLKAQAEAATPSQPAARHVAKRAPAPAPGTRQTTATMAPSQQSGSAGPAATSAQAGATSTGVSLPQSASTSAVPETAASEAKPGVGGTPVGAAPAGSAALASAHADDAPQELNVLRENSVTLNPAGFEVSTEADYVTRQTSLQEDHGFLSTTSIRYGVLRWLELSLSLPAGYTNRSTNTSPGTQVNRTVSGLGDVLLQANARVVDQTRDWPGVVVSLGAYFPTGNSPYNFTGYQLDRPNAARTPNPTDVLSYYYTQGDWGVRSNLQLYKTVDPLILFFGIGTNYYLPQRFNGYSVSTGVSLNYNFGFSFAASEKTTLGFTINGAYLPGIRVDNRTVFGSSGEPITARLSLIQRIAKGMYIEPSVVFGLNQDAPDFGLGLGLRARF